MTELVPWLLDQIAEDERIAREGFSNQADPEHGWGTADVEVANPKGMRPAVVVKLVVTPHVGAIHEEVQRAHIVRWHPGRVLAECDAKRRIIKEYERYAAERRRAMGGWDTAEVSPILAALALPYADRPGYRETWRP